MSLPAQLNIELQKQDFSAAERVKTPQGCCGEGEKKKKETS